MTAQEWHEFVGKLDAHDRMLLQGALDRMGTVLEHFRNNTLTDIQGIERRLDEQKQRNDQRYDLLLARIAALERRDADGT